ncbi:TIM barrel oxidoreductase NifR3 [Desulfuromonas sp. DDH964]|uniref:tRNA dihydrouridine synthase n=1 Tax=Desulfuromonas sp. DDH964 TaxID=1823759 RepID=UPI00078CD6EB|nr:tRNA-dihydrouridine synthase family protein [Desulfuromonas sp. DDH964]AMV73389.1 TIM barrel oxidoreductase NifR3 [Desulfuromonas sp. DDH964]
MTPAGGIELRLPWASGTKPLMLAPLQGVTNRALRAWFCTHVRPDVVFTEFLRVKGGARGQLAAADLREIVPPPAGVPLVVQLVGHDRDGLVAAARAARSAGATHLNLNMGCPYGRMNSGLSGGGMLRRPELLPELLAALRAAVDCSLSVKLRAGYDDQRQIFDLLPMLERARIDFLVLHPRTVVQQYAGAADHRLTAAVVAATPLPVIANGDIVDARQGQTILAATGAAGLMLGRGAIGDPQLFTRLRQAAPGAPAAAQRRSELHDYLRDLAADYRELFCGEAQVLAKLKEVLAFIAEPELAGVVRELRRSKTRREFETVLEKLPEPQPQ